MCDSLGLQVEFFEGWKPLSPLQLAVEKLLRLKDFKMILRVTTAQIVEQEFKRSVTSSSNSSSQNVSFVSTPSSSNEDNTINVQVNTASTNVSTASLSDARIYAFLANQPNRSQVVHEDLEQIHEDDLEEMDLKWQLALLSLKARNFYQRIGKKIIINGSDIAGYNKSKVECFNCHKMRHFARECRGFDWSFMANEEVPTNLALKAFSTQDASFKDSEINALNIQIEKLKKDKESNQIKIDKFKNASKSLDKLIGGQISDNNRKGVGYNSIPPPPIGLFSPPTIDLSSSGLKEFQQPEFEGYGVNVSDCDEDECEEMISDNVQHKSEPKPEQAKQPRKINENPRNSRTNWNEKKTQKLGVGFKFTKKACFVCGSFNHLIKDCDFHDKKMVQKPVINNVQKGTGQRESGIVPISTARQRCSKAAAPLSAARPINTTTPKLFVNATKTKPNIFQKAHSLSRRPFNQQTALNNRSLNNKINTAKINSINTAKGKRVTNAVGKQGINVVKSSAC
ncbi:ribonuclease H-like domain-containing protein [Tanacetum coccineum]